MLNNKFLKEKKIDYKKNYNNLLLGLKKEKPMIKPYFIIDDKKKFENLFSNSNDDENKPKKNSGCIVVSSIFLCVTLIIFVKYN